jgi:hypothetical protein
MCLGSAAAIEPDSSAGVVVWENTWAAPFASAVRRSGGQLVAGGRIPTQALLARSRLMSEKKQQPQQLKQPAMPDLSSGPGIVDPSVRITPWR